MLNENQVIYERPIFLFKLFSDEKKNVNTIIVVHHFNK